MKKNYTFATISFIAMLTACTNDAFQEVISEERTMTENVADIISFSPVKNNMTRADKVGEEAATILNNQFFVYGEKSTSASPVFPSFDVEYVGTGNLTETNQKGWEYVGLTGYESQTVRYWDYAADNYKFIAWAPTTSGATASNVTMNGFKVNATSPDQISKFYVADKRMVKKDDYQKVVTLQFRSLAAKVRLAIYEDIPGYTVSEITFRYAAIPDYLPLGSRHSTDAILDGTFNNAKGGDFTVTYPDTFGVATVALPGTTPVTRYNFGAFPQGVIGTTSTDPTWAGGSDEYQLVMPNQDNASDMQLVINYTLISEDLNDTLRVKGAHVTVPAEYVTWKPNFAYTYYFKLTDDTNGTTGRDPYNPDPSDGDDPYYPDPSDIDPTDPDGPGPNPFYPGFDPSNPDPDDPDGPDPQLPGDAPDDPSDPSNPYHPYDPNDPTKDVEGLHPIVFDAVVIDYVDPNAATEWEIKD